jgi:hypothetical protein
MYTVLVVLSAVGFFSFARATTVNTQPQASDEIELGDAEVITALIVGIDKQISQIPVCSKWIQ